MEKNTTFSYNLVSKFIAIIMSIVIMASLFTVDGQKNHVVAATDTFENSISGFPNSYKPYLRELHNKYPNWKFVPYNTNLVFGTAVDKESESNRSLMENAYSKYLKSNAAGDYDAVKGKYIAKDGSSWVTASKNCVSYFMDPRNFLDKEHIYMFEQLSFDAASQTRDGVEAILQGSYMYRTNIGYIGTDGRYNATSDLYSKVILDAARKTNVSAFYLASKTILETGTGKNSKYAGMGASGSVSGTYSSKYTGIYNFYNIGASTSANPIANGLSWASSGNTYERPWNTPYKSILGGAEYIGEKYINCGQNSTYFQRFNVRSDSKYSLYNHQYMTNIYGAVSESISTYEAYNSMGIASNAKTFVIPVYKNMPPDNNTIKIGGTTKAGTVVSSVNVRKGPSTEYATLTSLDAKDAVKVTDCVMTTVKFGTRWLSNPYWYKISATKNGKSYVGYVSAQYINVNKDYDLVKGTKMKLPVTLGSSEVVYYLSDNPAIATVDTSGYVTGVKNGTVTVRAFTSCGKFAVATIQVFDKGCLINPTTLKLDVGKKKTLKTTVYPTNSTNKTVTYTSSNKAIASVSSKGKVKAKKVGKVTITATAAVGGVQGKCVVTVVQPVTGIGLNKTQSKMTVGKTEKLAVTILPSNATNKKVKWSSSDKGIATVSKGTVTAKSAGTVTITVKSKSDSKKIATCKITVTPAKPVIKVKAKKNKTIKISWNKTYCISGYWVYRKTGKGKYKVIARVSGGKTSYKDKKLKGGQKYTYKVKSYRIIGKTKYKSKKSKARSTIAKK